MCIIVVCSLVYLIVVGCMNLWGILGCCLYVVCFIFQILVVMQEGVRNVGFVDCLFCGMVYFSQGKGVIFGIYYVGISDKFNICIFGSLNCSLMLVDMCFIVVICGDEQQVIYISESFGKCIWLIEIIMMNVNILSMQCFCFFWVLYIYSQIFGGYCF